MGDILAFVFVTLRFWFGVGLEETRRASDVVDQIA